MSYTVMQAAQARFADYADDAFNLLRRPGLEAALRAEVPDLAQWPRARWPEHAKFDALASHWLGIHASMRQHWDVIAAGLAELADGNVAADRIAEQHAGIRTIAGHALQHAHGHHRLEDNHYFPRFRAAAPAIARPLALLDADHRVLEASLQEFSRFLGDSPAEPGTPDDYAPWAGSAGELARIMARHLDDEEDIIMPTILRTS